MRPRRRAGFPWSAPRRSPAGLVCGHVIADFLARHGGMAAIVSAATIRTAIGADIGVPGNLVISRSAILSTKAQIRMMIPRRQRRA